MANPFIKSGMLKFKRLFTKKRVHPIDIYEMNSKYDTVTNSQIGGVKLSVPVIAVIIVCIVCVVA